MCGFAGIVAWTENHRISPDLLERMSARIAHRGPDGQGLHLNHGAAVNPDQPQVGLVHRRLAIVDLDPRANQPFADPWGRLLVFNGEIYNYRALRREITQLKGDYPWRTQSDTEVLLAAYEVWGEKCVDHLNGMFAFAIWDARERSLYMAVDRMGQKPLYVAAIDVNGAFWTAQCRDFQRWSPLDSPARRAWDFGPPMSEAINPPLAAIAFASELGALREVPWVGGEIDWIALHGYLSLGYIPAPRSVLKGARKFCAGMQATIRHDRLKGALYFSPCGVHSGRPLADAPRTARRLIEQAVRRQLVADVPVGCLLSGGIDSSVIAAAMKAAAPLDQPVHTFSIAFDDPRYDESEYARGVAAHLGTEHHQFRVQPDAAADLPRLAEVFGEPFGDSSALPTHYLARETRGHVKVALGGDGGDELFGGYDRYRAIDAARSLERLPSWVRALAGSLIWQRLPGSHPKSLLTRLKRFVATSNLQSGQRYVRWMSIFSPELIDQLIVSPALRAASPASLGDWMSALFLSLRVDCASASAAAIALDRLTYLPGDLLTKLDRASMLHALEVRSPFMDHELVQWAGGLTNDQLYRGGAKRMLREAFAADLPAFVFKRRKMGFAVPIGQWFRGPLKPMLRDHVLASTSFASAHFSRAVLDRLLDEHDSGRSDHSQRLYALLMLELWWKTL